MSKAILKPVISYLREEIIKSIAGKMERYGFDTNGNIAQNKPLSDLDRTIKDNLINIFKGKGITGDKDKYIEYIQDSARTFLHILISFKAMEERNLISKIIERLLGHGLYNRVVPDFNNVSPMAFIELSQKYAEDIENMMNKDNRGEDIEYYNFIFILTELSKEMAKEVPLLFKGYEYNLVHPDFNGIKAIIFNLNNIEDQAYLEDDFLGWIYQYWVDVKESEIKLAKSNKDISYSHNIYYEILKSLEKEQAQFGEFYTPRWVVKYIVDNTLKPYFEENKNIENIKLLDPACGAGNFLVYAFDVFYDLYKMEHPVWNDKTIINSILDKNIFGVDIQKEPLQITAINLWLKAKKKAQDVNIQHFNLFNMNILKANSLHRYENDPDINLQLSLFGQELELTEKIYSAEDIGRYITSQKYMAQRDAKLFFKNRFNIIVMNPPFVDARKMDPFTSDFLKAEYPNNARNLFSAFIERAMEITVKKGIVGFISSDTFLTLSSFLEIRKEILSKTIFEAVLLGSNVFDGPTVSACILIIKNEVSRNNEILIRKTQENVIDPKYKIKLLQSKLCEIKGYPFIFNISDNIGKIFKSKSLGDYNQFEVRKGIVTANDNKYLKYKWEVKTESIGNEFLRYNKEHTKILTDLNYVLDWRDKTKIEILGNSSSRCAYIVNNFIKGEKCYRFKKGVVFKLVGDFDCALLDDDRVFNVTTPAVLMDNTRYQYYMLSYLNSKFTKYVLKALNSTISNTPGDVRRLPFKIPCQKRLDSINGFTRRIIEIKEYLLGFNYISDFYHNVGLQYGFNNGAKSIAESYKIFINKYNELENELYLLQLEIDQIIYKIYELDEEDIRVIEEEYPNSPPEPSKDNEIKKVVLNYIRAITKDILIANPARLYMDIEIENLIKQSIESKFENGYKIVEEIEAILEKPLIEIIRVGVKVGSTNISLAGKGSKDLDEPILQQRIIAGSGKNKHVVIWHLTHFLLEFEDDKKYIMQNEIRRLNNNFYRPYLKNIKEKLQLNINVTERKILESKEKLFSDSIKTLENWKVVD